MVFADISELNLNSGDTIVFPDGKDKLLHFQITMRPKEGIYRCTIPSKNTPPPIGRSDEALLSVHCYVLLLSYSAQYGMNEEAALLRQGPWSQSYTLDPRP